MDFTFHSSGPRDASIDLEFGGVRGHAYGFFHIRPLSETWIGFLALRFVRDYCRRRGIEALELQVQRANRQASPSTGEPGFSRFRAW
jgi:GNAT superfamily N-acetyltransferase